MPNEHVHIEQPSEEVQDILSHVPNWLIRWGITAILGILVLLLAMTFVIRYPITLTGTATLSTREAAVKVVSKASGELVKIHFHENESVQKGDVLAEVTSSLSSKDVAYLEQVMVQVDSLLIYEQPIALLPPKKLLLGEALTEYHQLERAADAYQRQLFEEAFARQQRQITDKLSYNRELLDISEEQKKLTALELANKKIKYEGNSILYAQGGMAKFDFLNLENEYLQKKKEYQSMRRNCVQLKLLLSELQNELDELVASHAIELQIQKKALEQALYNLKGLLDNWARNHLIYAAIDGDLSYISAIQEQEFVTAGKPLFAIVPHDDHYVAQVHVPSTGSGKLALNQTVRLKFHNYPDHEYGIVKGQVSQIALLPEGNQYRVVVNLPKGLLTSYGKQIDFKPEMTGQADIVVDNTLLIERVFSQLKQLLNQQ